VVASNLNPPSDGTTPTDLTVTLTDEFGNPVAGKTISLAALPLGNSAVIKTVNSVTNSEGKAAFTATDATGEVVTFQATDVTDGDVAFTSAAVVTFGTPSTAPVPSATTSDVVLSRTLSPADGRTQTLVIVTVNDQFDNPVVGNVVELQGTGSVRTQGIAVDGAAPGITDSSGIAEFVATDTVAEIVTYRVLDSSTGFYLADQPMETFQTPGPPPSTPEIASPALLPLSAIAFGGIAYGISQIRRRKRARRVAK
jgi:hypothetical protein